MNYGGNCSLLTTLLSHTPTLLSMSLTLFSDILLSNDKVRGLHIELKEDATQNKEVVEE